MSFALGTLIVLAACLVAVTILARFSTAPEPTEPGEWGTWE